MSTEPYGWRVLRLLSSFCDLDHDTAHRYLDPETFTAATGLGADQGVTDRVPMSADPGR